jgi:Flp pilus assembly protein TadD
LILDVYPLKRLGGGTGKWLGAEARRIALEKAPFAILAVIFGMVALRAQEGTGALKAVERYDLGSRFAQGLYGLVFYLWKSVLPLGLSPLYELPLQLDPRDWQFILSGFVVLAVSAGVYLFRRAWPAGVALWIYYLVVLLPVLGIAQSGPQLVADRYSYLSCLGWAILGGAGLKYLWVAAGRITAESRFLLPPAIAAIVVFILGVATWRQTRVWSDSESLWKHALAVGQESSTVHFNLGHALQKRGDLTQAVEHYRKSLEFNPLAADAHYYLADALAVRGLLGEAVEHYGRAIEINPEFWGAHYNLAIVLERQGKLDAATGHYRRAVAINPADVEAHNNLALVLSRQGEFNEAAEYFRESLKVAPSQSRVYLALANIMARQGDYEQAVQNYRQAIRIQPNYAAAHEGLARVLAQQGKKDEAMRHYSEALSLLKSRRGAAPASR